MRLGSNPQKYEGLLQLDKNHRVVIVTYIPKLEGYYEKMFDVIKLCVDSVIKTIPSSSAITIVDNASCKEVTDYFIELYKGKKIDTLQLLSINVGKIDAQMGAARSAREPIITLTDCDILFRSGWVEETVSVFNAFKKVGSVSPIPTRANTFFTFSVQQDILMKKLKVKYKSIPENFYNYSLFLKSINWDNNNDENIIWPIIEEDDVKAIIGSDHQVLTLRRDILFNQSPGEPSFAKVGKGSENRYVDLAIDLSGYYRLSTYHYYAHHIGNCIEDWMEDTSRQLKRFRGETKLDLTPELHYRKASELKYKIKKKIIKLLFKNKV